MKRFFCLGMIAAAVLFVGCDKEQEEQAIWDFAVASFEFAAVDATTGANLLDPDADHNLLGQPIAVVFDRKRFDLLLPDMPQSAASTTTRLLMPKPLELRLEWRYKWMKVEGVWKEVLSEDGYLLTFGEFSPVSDWKGKEFTLEWGDGTSNIVRFDFYIEWKGVNDPEVHSLVWLDGEKQDGWRMKFRK